MSPTSEKDRRVITCLRCFKPQEQLPVHLATKCMKNSSKDDRKAELDRAKKSMKAWTLQGRTWDYNVMVRRYPDEASRQALLVDLRERQFLILNDPMTPPAELSHRPPDTAAETHNKKPSLPTVRDCQQVLAVSHTDMLDIQRRLLNDQHVDSHERFKFRYFCETILVLKYFQRPEAVMAITALDWINKKHVAGRIHVQITKTNKTISLTEDDSAMLDTYFHHVRSANGEDQGRFFLSSLGIPVASITHDLKRLHKEYELPSFSSREVREAQRIGILTCSASDVPPIDERGRKQKRGRAPSDQDSSTFGSFIQHFPATASSSPPTKKKRTAAGFPADRVFYDRWRSLQLANREEHILSQCTRRPPTVSRVSLLLKKEGWTSNCPRPEDVLAKWKPARKVQVESDPRILAKINSQKWSGLVLKNFGDTKGIGVVSTKSFPMGSIVCDYHGKVITGAEGRKMMVSIQGEMGYLFFFRGGGRDLCIDAQTFPCECHPNDDTIGRRINHSSKKANVRAVYCNMNFPEGTRDTILLRATRHINMGEELLFNYGVKRRSFRGEGLDLEWLDQ